MISHDVIGLGALNWDLFYELPDFSVLEDLEINLIPGEEIHIEGNQLSSLVNLLNLKGVKRYESGGGQAANTIYALTKMGFKTGFIGNAGRDDCGDLILKELDGVNSVFVNRAGRSGICISIITPPNERTLMVFPGINNEFKTDAMMIENISHFRFLHLSSFASIGPLKAQIELLKGLRNQTLVSFDPGNLYANLGLEPLTPIIKKTYCLFVTETEIKKISGLNIHEAVDLFFTLGVKIVICKQGSKGAYILSPEENIYLPPVDVQIKDVTGAGDCFAAGFLAGLLKGYDLYLSGQLGTLVAAESIQGYGRESYPDERIFKKLE